jgi:ketosteroid isomerase-like protein
METFKVILNDEEENGVFAISHVLDPAIEAMYVFMGNEKDVEIKLATVSDEKRIVVGPVLIPNQLILRKHPTTGDPFNIFFDAETIKHIQENFVSKSYQNNSTIEHDGKLIEDVSFVETWIKEDDVHDKSVLYGFDQPIGTMFAMQKVKNDDVWNDYIKTGKVKGFSIDGVFDLEKINLKSEYMDSKDAGIGKKIIDAIKEGFASLSLSNETEPVVEITEEPIKLAQMKLKDGVTVLEAESFEVGKEVVVVAEDGTKTPAPEGEHQLEDDSFIVVDAEGKITEVKPKAEEEVVIEETEVEMTTEQINARLADITIPMDLETLTKVVKLLFKDRFQWQIQEQETKAMIEEFSTTMTTELIKATAKEIEKVKVDLRKEIDAAKAVVVELTAETKEVPPAEKPFEQMTRLEKRRVIKQEFK